MRTFFLKRLDVIARSGATKQSNQFSRILSERFSDKLLLLSYVSRFAMEKVGLRLDLFNQFYS